MTIGDLNCNNDETVFCGMLVYASFAKSATKDKVMQAAKTIMNLPVLTRGMWGDASETASALELASEGGNVGVMLVPQANLISKVNKCVLGLVLYLHIIDS